MQRREESSLDTLEKRVLEKDRNNVLVVDEMRQCLEEIINRSPSVSSMRTVFLH